MDKREIVAKFLDKNAELASRKVARMLFSKHVGLWPSEDACYQAVRFCRGKKGESSRRSFPSPPASVATSVKAERLDDKGRWLVVNDIHCPYHSEVAVEAAFRHAVDNGADHLLINGDAIEGKKNSRWLEKPDAMGVDQELDVLKELIKAYSPYFKRKVFKVGNHEQRIETYLFSSAPNMVGISTWSLCDELQKRLDIPDWTMIGSLQMYTLGKLHGYHGHELSLSSVNPSRSLWTKTKQSAFAGHHHQIGTHVETSANKSKTWVCFSIGCLCRLDPEYLPINNWSNGHALIDIGDRGGFNEQNCRIFDGKVYS